MGNRQHGSRRYRRYRAYERRHQEAISGVAQWQACCCGTMREGPLMSMEGHPHKMWMPCNSCSFQNAVHYKVGTDLWRGWVTDQAKKKDRR